MEWNRTDESLPPDETPVLIVHRGNVKIGEIRWEHPAHGEAFSAFQFWDDPSNDGQNWDWGDVTHWMPIPEWSDSNG